MTHRTRFDTRTQLKALPRTAAIKNGKARRFQVDLELKGVLSGDELIAELAKCGFNNSTIQAHTALLVVEGFIEQKLAEGFQVDLGLASFVPRLSGALSTRDADPETDGLYVQGTVNARAKLRHALKDKVEASNVLAKKFIRLYNVLDTDTHRFDEIEAGHTLSVTGHDIAIDKDSPDEGFWIEKRSGRWNRKPRLVQKAEVIESSCDDAKIVFRDPIPRGKYTLVVGTRCGEGRDYKLRRVGHPVKAI